MEFSDGELSWILRYLRVFCMSMDLMPYFSSYLFSTKKFFHSTSKSTKVEVATKVKVIYVNNKRWGADVLCVSSYVSIP